MKKRFAEMFVLLLMCGIMHSPVAARPTEGWRKKQSGSGNAIAFNPLNPNTIFAAVSGFGGEHISVSYDRGQTWPLQMSPGIDQINQILVHPSDTLTIFCAGSPDMRKSTDGGATWKTVLPGYTIDGESIVIDPQHPDTLHAAEFTLGKVYRSTDRGEHWLDSSLSVNNVSALSIRPDNPNILYAGTGLGSISKSTDAGKNWRIVKHPVSAGVLGTKKICVSATSPLIAYAAFDGGVDTSVGVWKTTNGGEVWTRTGATGLPVRGLDIDPFDPDIVYAGSASATAMAIYRSTDGGNSWVTLKVGLPPAGSVQMIKIHPLDPGVNWIAALDGVTGAGGAYRYGVTSSSISGAVLNASSLDTVKNGFLVTSPVKDSINLDVSAGTFAMYYFDGDPSVSAALRTQAYPFYASLPSLTFVPGQDDHHDILLQELAKRSITGVVRDSVSTAPRRALLRLHAVTSVGSSTYRDSADAGGVFRFDSLYITYPPINGYDELVVGPDLPYGRQRFAPIPLDTNGTSLTANLTIGDVLIVGATDSLAYMPYYQTALESLQLSYNFWDEKSRGIAPMSVAGVFRKKTLIYYTGSSHSSIPRAELDSLQSALDSGCSLFLTGQDVAEKNDTSKLMKEYLHTGFQGNTLIAYVTGLPGDIFYPLGFNTVNFGASNQTSRDILKPLDPRSKPVIGYGYGNLGTASVRIDSVGGGGRAIVMGFGFEAISGEDVRIKVMQNAIDYLSGVVLGVEDRRTDSPYPADFRLEQNFPNPFNPSTQIRYSIAEVSEVDLSVIDLTGRSVATLTQGQRSAGSYSLSWDASGFPSGVYFYRLIATPSGGRQPARSSSKMMVLIK